MRAIMSDYIKKIQAMVGCPHEWGYDDSWHGSVCGVCGMTWEHDVDGDAPTPAPDCSTLWGAMQAAKDVRKSGCSKLSLDIRTVNGSIHIGLASYKEWADDVYTTEADAAEAVCKLILEAVVVTVVVAILIAVVLFFLMPYVAEVFAQGGYAYGGVGGGYVK